MSSTPTPLPARVLFGQRLRTAREALGLSQEAFALKAGIDRTYVSSIEKGKRNVACDNMERLAAAAGKELWELLKP